MNRRSTGPRCNSPESTYAYISAFNCLSHCKPVSLIEFDEFALCQVNRLYRE
jgi:hypothetical protein